MPTRSVALRAAARAAAVRKKPDAPPRATPAPTPPPKRSTCLRVSGCSTQFDCFSLTAVASCRREEVVVQASGWGLRVARASSLGLRDGDRLARQLRHAPASRGVRRLPFRQLLQLDGAAVEGEWTARRERAADLDVALLELLPQLH